MSIQTTAPATIGSSRGHTTPASLAAALRHAAEQIEAIGAVELDPTILTVNLQVTTQAGTRETRIATVDALNVALTGVPGEHGEMDTQHSTPYSHHYGTHYDISVYAGLEDSKLNPNRKAAEAERAELIEQAEAAPFEVRKVGYAVSVNVVDGVPQCHCCQEPMVERDDGWMCATGSAVLDVLAPLAARLDAATRDGSDR